MIVLLYFLLRYIPTVSIDLCTILTIILIYIVVQFFLDTFTTTEGLMTNFMEGGVGKSVPYNLYDQDNYYPFNEDLDASEDGIPYELAPQLIEESKQNDLLNQHNFNIVSSPHTHVGKDRSYLNWEEPHEETL